MTQIVIRSRRVHLQWTQLAAPSNDHEPVHASPVANDNADLGGAA